MIDERIKKLKERRSTGRIATADGADAGGTRPERPDYPGTTSMYEALMFLPIGYSVSTTLFQMIRSKIFISDCVVFFDTIATFTQTIAG